MKINNYVKRFTAVFVSTVLLSVFFIECDSKKVKTAEEIEKLVLVFDSAKQKPSTDYDLEETIRIIHGLDMARKEMNNFTEYCEYMAKQDYSKVAPDVIEAKMMLLPILNKLLLAEEKLKDIQSLWKTFSDIPEVVLPATVELTNDPSNMPQFLVLTANEFFSAVQKQKKMEKDVKKEISSIQNRYIEYLTFFTPIYKKYMDEWDYICLARDAAYINLHENNIESMLVCTDKVLDRDPKNKEANILKAFGLFMKAQQEPKLILQNEEINDNKFDYAEEAKSILDHYIENNTKFSAPALLLLGTYYSLKGDKNSAIEKYNESEKEYPRQSELLLDMLNSYKQRTYLSKSVEGTYILQLYKATMEGYGFFSPNFQKALIAKNNNDLETAKEEILKHFFRRGNQGVYDYMIDDMIHCETYLPESFNMIFREKSFLDLEATAGMFNSKNLNLKVHNRSDIHLSNVRVFLCLHLTDMYKDDYVVIKMPATRNYIEPHSVADFGKVEIDIELYNKKKNANNDIVTSRAIILTDDIITWVDEVDFKINRIKQSFDHYSNIIKPSVEFDKFYATFGINGENVLKSVKNETSIESKIRLIGKDLLIIKLPRNLVLLNPYFSINEIDTKEAVFPSSLNLNGSTIDIQIEQKIPKNDSLDFYLTSEKAKMKWIIFFDQDGNVKDYLVELL